MTFKDPDSDTDKNTIEILWLRAKKSLPRYGSRHNHIESYLIKYPWRKKYKEVPDIFLTFIYDDDDDDDLFRTKRYSTHRET